MTSDDLRAWQSAMQFTYDSAADALGVSRATYANYINDHTRIPKMLGLACAALCAKLESWTA
ncbi:helix-turn-helix transcriptional regulator [Glaciimonas immobilis]|uniref:Transcriptional regulator with XRE-family HTH domain n=1 Tax=Glaciimonas immobilis TaxID=728004 RepID=A0A840RV74_9BURK|nr:helix-turn-helix transcriptional regulator [Glaciimonas immobilis]KAF3997530.1 helix-turn-helix transcriptional regulator [Glaciimonas immobilis]MBB5200786.1 transcriptional regulator with XRE-family HTH domain [Glaciimonas immobilis]